MNTINKTHTEQSVRYTYTNGTVVYRLYCVYGGLLHREDGPAVISPSGFGEYWLNGKKQSKKVFELRADKFLINTK